MASLCVNIIAHSILDLDFGIPTVASCGMNAFAMEILPGTQFAGGPRTVLTGLESWPLIMVSNFSFFCVSLFFSNPLSSYKDRSIRNHILVDYEFHESYVVNRGSSIISFFSITQILIEGNLNLDPFLYLYQVSIAYFNPYLYIDITIHIHIRVHLLFATYIYIEIFSHNKC